MHFVKFIPVYVASLFFSLHYATIIYINSTYLGNFFDPIMVSLLFVIGALGNVYVFSKMPRLLNVLGDRNLFLIFILLEFIATLGLALSKTPLYIAIFFIIYEAIVILIFFSLDIFLEALSTDNRTGGIRGTYLTLINAAIAFSPLIFGYLVSADELAPVYIVSSAFLAPVFIIGLVFFKRITKRARSDKLNLPLRSWWRAKNVRRVTIARFILEFFFAIMLIYTPIYLHQIIGFAWSEIGIIFTIMLLPFVLFQWPAGEIADRWLGEKELMTTAFFISGIALIIMPFVGKDLAIWAGILFLSRVGASVLEITTESYFFKHVDARDNGLISVFRLSRPLSIIAGSLVGALTVLIFPYQAIFLVLAVAILLGLHQSVYLKDTL